MNTLLRVNILLNISHFGNGFLQAIKCTDNNIIMHHHKCTIHVSASNSNVFSIFLKAITEKTIEAKPRENTKN